MSKYQYTEKCREISGFGGTYEEGCRKMVVAGMEWMDNNKEANPQFSTVKDIYGLIHSEDEEAKQLTKHMNKAANNEATGGMMECCVNHVRYAHQNGWDKYIEVMEKKDE